LLDHSNRQYSANYYQKATLKKRKPRKQTKNKIKIHTQGSELKDQSQKSKLNKNLITKIENQVKRSVSKPKVKSIFRTKLEKPT
jgi:hypothetical protein